MAAQEKLFESHVAWVASLRAQYDAVGADANPTIVLHERFNDAIDFDSEPPVYRSLTGSTGSSKIPTLCRGSPCATTSTSTLSRLCTAHSPPQPCRTQLTHVRIVHSMTYTHTQPGCGACPRLCNVSARSSSSQPDSSLRRPLRTTERVKLSTVGHLSYCTFSVPQQTDTLRAPAFS